MTEQILRSALHHALKLDPELSEWFMTRLNMSHRAHAHFIEVSEIAEWGYDEEGSDMFAMVDNRGHNVALHLCPVLRNLDIGLGQAASSRARKMQEANAPTRHESHRVVLIAPAGLVRQHWQAAREFPYWVDFDALTRRQLDRSAA